MFYNWFFLCISIVVLYIPSFNPDVTADCELRNSNINWKTLQISCIMIAQWTVITVLSRQSTWQLLTLSSSSWVSHRNKRSNWYCCSKIILGFYLDVDSRYFGSKNINIFAQISCNWQHEYNLFTQAQNWQWHCLHICIWHIVVTTCTIDTDNLG